MAPRPPATLRPKSWASQPPGASNLYTLPPMPTTTMAAIAKPTIERRNTLVSLMGFTVAW